MDEKSFTVFPPVNSQNDRLYSAAAKKRQVPEGRLVRERAHFSRNIIVSVGVSRMGKTNVVFVEPKLTTNITVIKFSDKVCFWTFKRDVVVISGHCSRTELPLILPETLLTFCIRIISPSLNQTCSHQTVLI